MKTAAASIQNRTKLRRSRSACDIRDMIRPLKRAESTLAPIPAKTARLMSSNSTSSNRMPPRPVTDNPNRKHNTLPAARSAAATTTTTGAIKKANSSPSAASATPASTTGAGNTINKRIPPYDFKARFHDLLDKHKVLKEKYDEKCEQMDTYENLPEQLEESQNLLYTTQEQLKNCKTEKECLQQLVNSQSAKIDMISKSLVKYKEQLEELQEAHKVRTCLSMLQKCIRPFIIKSSPKICMRLSVLFMHKFVYLCMPFFCSFTQRNFCAEV